MSKMNTPNEYTKPLEDDIIDDEYIKTQLEELRNLKELEERVKHPEYERDMNAILYPYM